MTNNNDLIRREDAIALTLLGDAKTVADAIAAIPAVAASQPADPVTNADSRQRVVVKPLWKPIETAPRNGEWFIARTEHGTKRVVHYADEYDRFPISHDGVCWSTPPVSWTDLKPVLAALDVQPDPRDAQIDEATAFDRADWYWRAMDPDDSGETPNDAVNRGMLGQFCVCEIASSYRGPTRYGFLAPTLDPESDDEEFVHFATHDEAMEAAKARAAIAAVKGGDA